MNSFPTASLASLPLILAAPAAVGQHGTLGGEPGAPPLDFRALEAPLLVDHVQLTHRDRFVKAGEAYFCPDASWIVFQAVPVPPEGEEASPFYSMYVAKLVRDAGGRVTGIEEPIEISPPGSANTCGWFHPLVPYRVIFGSTIEPPRATEAPGFRGGSGRYVWSFPEEMEVVIRSVPEIFTDMNPGVPAPLWGPDAISPVPLFERPEYDAECSYSPDGRFILYTHVTGRNPDGSAEADIWIFDTETDEHHEIVTAPGYDGGPFFSPCGRYITYRSDRVGNNLLQLFIAKLAFEGGVPTGIEWERQVTDNEHVNWCPYWHPSGRFLVYATSEVAHWNYEVYAAEISEALRAGDAGPEDVRRIRITYANGADVLPAFSPDGSLMMWTAQRGPTVAGENRPSSQLWIASVDPELDPGALFHRLSEEEAMAAAEGYVAEHLGLPGPFETRFDTRHGDYLVTVWQLPKSATNLRRLVMTPAGRVLSVISRE